MQKYDVQQLLKQQKNSIYQSILTILLAVLLGISSSIFFELIPTSISDDLLLICASLIFSVLIIIPIFVVFRGRNKLIKIKKENMTLLVTLSHENNSIKPIKFNEYPFSVYFSDNWDSVIEKNGDYKNAFVNESNNLIDNSRQDDQNDFKYKVITDLFQYNILRKISGNNLSRKGRDSIGWSGRIQNWFIRRANQIKILRKIKFIDKYCNRKEILEKLHFFSDGIPLVFQDEQIKENLFVKTIHAQQIEYENQILNEESNENAHMYIPFYLNFPTGINFNLEKSDKSKLDKIVLESKYGKVTIEFHDRWNFSSQKTFMYTTMRPGKLHHNYKEYYTEMSIDLDIKKYAYFPLIGGDEESVDEFYSWANQLIEDLRLFCDWNYFENNVTRETFQQIFNKLDYQDLENKIENYNNFKDTKYGEIQRLLRHTISPHFEYRKHAIKKIVEQKNEISIYQMESVILRMLRLTNYEDTVTKFMATEALGDFEKKIPTNLHENVVGRLIELTEDGEIAVETNSIKSLSKLFFYVDVDLKRLIQEQIIQLYLRNLSIDYVCVEALKSIYPHIILNERQKFEEKYLEILMANDADLIDALKFYVGIRDYISPIQVKDVISATLDIDTRDLSILDQYLRFIDFFSDKMSNSLLLNYYEKIISFLEHDDLKIKEKTLHFLELRSFIDCLDAVGKENIYTKIENFTRSNDEELKHTSTETLAKVGEYFTGKEEEITEILFEKIETDPYNSQDSFPYLVKDYFDKIKSNIDNTSLLERIDKFQDSLN
ncbi:MAG: hypothetical protein KAJ19_18950 [Gammaproteobacteria bacterium]|nr:hypothetical protein [Gammaproteobacteria bacterium]